MCDVGLKPTLAILTNASIHLCTDIFAKMDCDIHHNDERNNSVLTPHGMMTYSMKLVLI